MLKYAVLILWRKKGIAANFYAFCISVVHIPHFQTQQFLSVSFWTLTFCTSECLARRLVCPELCLLYHLFSPSLAASPSPSHSSSSSFFFSSFSAASPQQHHLQHHPSPQLEDHRQVRPDKWPSLAQEQLPSGSQD